MTTAAEQLDQPPQVPICAWCKKIRTDDGYWTQIETYVVQHSDAEFTHGICPDCAAEMQESS